MKPNNQGVRSVPLFQEELGSFGFVKEATITLSFYAIRF